MAEICPQGWSRARLLHSSLTASQQDRHPSVLTVCSWSKGPRLDDRPKEASLGVPVDAPQSHGGGAVGGTPPPRARLSPALHPLAIPIY